MISYYKNLQNHLRIVPIGAQPFDDNNNWRNNFMSRNHSAIAHQSNAVISELYNMNYEQMHELYGIDIEPSGKIVDTTYDMVFTNLSEWADWCVANDEFEEKEFVRGKHYGILT